MDTEIKNIMASVASLERVKPLADDGGCSTNAENKPGSKDNQMDTRKNCPSCEPSNW